jgi:hypothetical protein
VGVLNDTMVGIAEFMTSNGIKTFPYEAPKLPAPPPVATLFLHAPTPGQSDQARGDWSKLDVRLTYYVSWRQSASKAQEQMHDGLDTILAAFASDAQLDGCVVALKLPETDVPILVDHEEELLIAEWKLEVTPWR